MDESDIIDAILMPLDADGWNMIRDRGIDYVYPSGQTALGLAVTYEQEENVYLLLQKGANPNIVGEVGIPPLLDAYISRNPRLVILLLMYGANPEATDSEGSISSVAKMLSVEGSSDFLDTLFCHHPSTRNIQS